MHTVRAHYRHHLGRIYTWMAGGADHALALGSQDVAPFLGRPGYAVDLGAGFGMHAIPLARVGFQVLAVDQAGPLLAELRTLAAGLPVETVEADLMRFADHLRRPADLILCMGDTLAHLPTLRHVERLCASVRRALAAEGRFVAAFRDTGQLPAGDRRFIPVRSDADRILTCVLEATRTRVRVHDRLHERTAEGWSTTVGSYMKLRLDADRVVRAAAAAGLQCRVEAGPRGLLTIVATARADRGLQAPSH